MTKGRKPIPNELKALRGTDQPCRIKQDVMKVEPIRDMIKKIPSGHVLKTLRSKKIFITKANQLIALGVLTNFDLEQLSIYAYALDQVYSAMEELKSDKLFMEVKDAQTNSVKYIANPYFKVFKEMQEIVNKIGADFGFTPISRQKINPPVSEEKSPIQQLIAAME